MKRFKIVKIENKLIKFKESKSKVTYISPKMNTKIRLIALILSFNQNFDTFETKFYSIKEFIIKKIIRIYNFN